MDACSPTCSCSVMHIEYCTRHATQLRAHACLGVHSRVQLMEGVGLRRGRRIEEGVWGASAWYWALVAASPHACSPTPSCRALCAAAAATAGEGTHPVTAHQHRCEAGIPAHGHTCGSQGSLAEERARVGQRICRAAAQGRRRCSGRSSARACARVRAVTRCLHYRLDVLQNVV